MKNNKYTDLTAKKLANEISEDELSELHEWLEQSDDHRKEYELFESLWTKTKVSRTGKHADSAFNGISAAIEHDRESTSERSTKIRRISFSYMLSGVAAAVLLVIISIFAINKFNQKQESHANISFKTIEKALPKGQKMKIFLPDGSTVWLNAESSISYPERFDDTMRLVSLKGEGFFDVVKDTLKPFVVRTDFMDVKVVGTSFSVTSYPSEPSLQVALEKGKVIVHASGNTSDQIELSPGEGVSMNKKSGLVRKHNIDHKMSFGWKDGLLYFKKSDFHEVVDKLSKWYGVDIEVINYTGDKWEYSAEFRNDYLNNVLQSMSFTKGFNYEIDQNKVKIIFN